MKNEFYNKKYSIGQFYTILLKAIGSLRYLGKAKRAKLISSKLIERIMLAVTEVNGCPICAYEHTKMALEMGMSQEEIKQLLSGDTRNIPREEATAVIFAQHYADTSGNPTKSSWQQITQVYGEEKAKGILAATRIIMMGNVYGIALSAFGSRIKGKPIKNKFTFIYEVGMILSLLPFLPVVLIHILVFKILKRPIIVFNN